MELRFRLKKGLFAGTKASLELSSQLRLPSVSLANTCASCTACHHLWQEKQSILIECRKDQSSVSLPSRIWQKDLCVGQCVFHRELIRGISVHCLATRHWGPKSRDTNAPTWILNFSMSSRVRQTHPPPPPNHHFLTLRPTSGRLSL